MASDEDIAWLNSTFRPIPRPSLPDDCVEYTLFIIDALLAHDDELKTRESLKEVQKYASSLQKQWLSDYIWQRDSFNLEYIKQNGVSCLRGRTEYGDSIEDEWVIVWLLREITIKYNNVWLKITDSDGEFLLIEASATLPEWLEPEVAENRVWIHDGQLKIIKPAGGSKTKTEEKLTFEDARNVVLTQPKRIMHSTIMEGEAFHRLRNYPAQIRDNMHHAILSLPRKVVHLLQQKNSYVSPAVEAFYLRDPISLKALQGKNKDKLIFPPLDLVDVCVKFPKVAYAQLKSQDIGILAAWKGKLPIHADVAARTRVETGMRLTCGLEMLLTDSQYQDRSMVREMKLLLEDLESGDAELPTDEELQQLEMRQDDEKWLDIDFEDFQNVLDRGKSPGDLATRRDRKPGFGDKLAEENLQRIVKQFEAFMNEHENQDADGMFNEGDSDTEELGSDDDFDDGDGEDRDASFNDDEFAKIMTEMMGMPAEVMEEIRKGHIDALSNGAKASTLPGESSSGHGMTEVRQIDSVEELSSDEDEQVEELSRRIGEELRTTGVLDLEQDGDDDLEDFDRSFARNLMAGLKAHGGQAVSDVGSNVSTNKGKGTAKK